MTIDEAAVALGIRPTTLRQYISLGKFPREITQDAIERWRDRQASAMERRKLPGLRPRRLDWVRD